METNEMEEERVICDETEQREVPRTINENEQE